MLGKTKTNFVGGGITINLVIKNFKDLNLACKRHFSSHFLMASHERLLNVSITFIDKTDPSDLLQRKDYRRQTLKTMAPYGINIKDSV